MKKKVTLLIALSILMQYVTAPVVCAFNNVDPMAAVQEVVEVDPDPLPSVTVEEVSLPTVEEVEEEVILKSNREIAKEIIAGKWDSGEKRKKLLTEAGYDYDTIQAEVQKLLPKEEKKEVSLPSGKYPTAQHVWNWLIAEGWSEVVAAGVIGNMMAETGGQTLALTWDSEGGCGYGLIQWIGNRRALLKNKYGAVPTIDQQLRYMTDELYGTNGVSRQVTDYQFDMIFNASTPEDAAYAFASYYERCGQSYRWFRRDLARTAYNYFTQK